MSEKAIFIEALRKPDAAARAEYLDSACGHGTPLRDHLESLLREHERLGSFIESPAPGIRVPAAAPEETAPSGGAGAIRPDHLENHVLGDYRIVREIGRGGMGVVYEAEQISLGRTVALKTLPYVGMLDKTRLTRFKNEARAAASLEHSNVVHVHSVGTERGVHYYAMQFIDGQTVADLIAAERSQRHGHAESGAGESPGLSGNEPTLGFSVSSNAPSRGPESLKDTAKVGGPNATIPARRDEQTRIRSVVELVIQAAEALEHAHRMGIVHRDIKPSNLLVDADQHLWVTDFGLAMMEAEGNLTTSGSMLGTLRYMSPEQMRGDRHVLDHHTDIYSLGATLYEMLVLRPAFPDSDVTKLVRRIPHEEPVAPRRLNPAIPRDLETIVGKAMAKEPANRYATAGDLAADLRHFLNDEAILAKPPGVLARVRKWMCRHRGVVLASAATLLVAIAVAGLLLWNERRETLAALEREQEQREVAEEQRALADTAQQASQKNLTLALDAIQKLLENASSAELREIPQAQLARKKMLEDVLAFYDKFRVTTGDSAEVQLQAGETWMTLGSLARELNDPAQSRRCLQQASSSLKSLVKQAPGNYRYRIALMNVFLGHAWLEIHAFHDAEEARKWFESVRSSADKLAPKAEGDPFRDFQREIVSRQLCAREGLAYLAELAHDQRTHRALACESLQLLKDNPGLVDVYDQVRVLRHMAVAHMETAPAVADENFRETVKRSRQALQNDSTRFGRSWYTQVLLAAARFFRERDPRFATELAIESVQIADRLAGDFPALPDYARQRDTAVVLGVELLVIQSRRQEAAEMLDKLPERKTAQQCWEAARLCEKVGRDADAEALFDRALQLALDKETPDSDVHHWLRSLSLGSDSGRHPNIAAKWLPIATDKFPRDARSAVTLGIVHGQSGHPDEAFDLFQLAIEREPRNFEAYRNRGRLYLDVKKHAKAIDDYTRAIELNPQHADNWCMRGRILMVLQRYEEALSDLNKAIELWGKPHYFQVRAKAHFRLSHFDAALADLTAALGRNPKYVSVLNTIPLADVAACADVSFESGMRQLADRVVEYNGGSGPALRARAYLLTGLGEWTQAKKDLDAALKVEPDSAHAHNQLAWFLVTAREPSLLDPLRAVALATEAVELKPENANYWNTLGVAQYRAGDYAAAVESLTKAVQLPRGEHAYNYLFLAMSHWQLDNQEQARQWYNKSEQWISDNNMADENMADEELLRFQAEAEALLGAAPAEPKADASH